MFIPFIFLSIKYNEYKGGDPPPRWGGVLTLNFILTLRKLHTLLRQFPVIHNISTYFNT